MENGEQPITPTNIQQIGDNDYRATKLGDPSEYTTGVLGLTKREYFAAMAMQGLASYNGTMDEHNPETNASRAVEIADALLKELDK